MKFSKLALGILLMALVLSLIPIVSFSDTHNVPPCTPDSGKLCNPINANDLPTFIKKILEGVIKIGLPIIALALVYVGFLFVEARGNPEKLNKAKKALLYTVIGAAILLGSWAIAKLISDTVLSLD